MEVYREPIDGQRFMWMKSGFRDRRFEGKFLYDDQTLMEFIDAEPRMGVSTYNTEKLPSHAEARKMGYAVTHILDTDYSDFMIMYNCGEEPREKGSKVSKDNQIRIFNIFIRNDPTEISEEQSEKYK